MRGWIPLGLLILLVVVVGYAAYYNWQARQAVTSERIFLGPTQQACEQKPLEWCWLVREDPENDYRQWGGEIQGFTFEPGYAYDLEVIEAGNGKTSETGKEMDHELVRVVEQRPTAAVWLIQPQPGMMVTGEEVVTVRGGGRNLYEDNVVVEVIDERDEMLASRATVLEDEGETGEGVWEVTLSLPATVSARMKLVARSPVPMGVKLLPIASVWLVGEDQGGNITGREKMGQD